MVTDANILYASLHPVALQHALSTLLQCNVSSRPVQYRPRNTHATNGAVRIESCGSGGVLVVSSGAMYFQQQCNQSSVDVN
jgi:hypothetical protein